MSHKVIVKALFSVVLGLTLAGCGKELGRVPFSSEGTRSANLTLAAGEVAFWTDLQIAYEGDATLDYDIDLSQGGAVVASALCNPLGQLSVQLGLLEANIGSSHSRNVRGKMVCTATLPKAGPTDVQAKLVFGTRPTRLDLKKADLVVKQ